MYRYRNYKNKTLGTLAVLLVVSACHQRISLREDEQLSVLPVEIIFESMACHKVNKRVTQTDTDQWPDISPLAVSMNGQANVVFSEANDYYVVSFGEQTSGGYKIRLTSNRAQIKAGVLHLPVNISSPEGLSSAIITHPCVLLEIANPMGLSYSDVRIYDGLGD